MALASSGWDDYRGSGRAATSKLSGGTFFTSLVMGAALLASAATGLYLMRSGGLTDLAAPNAAPAPAAPTRSVDPAYQTLQSDAETFIRDSLRLTRSCADGCVDVAAELRMATRPGRSGRMAPARVARKASRPKLIQAPTAVALARPTAPRLP